MGSYGMFTNVPCLHCGKPTAKTLRERSICTACHVLQQRRLAVDRIDVGTEGLLDFREMLTYLRYYPSPAYVCHQRRLRFIECVLL